MGTEQIVGMLGASTIDIPTGLKEGNVKWIKSIYRELDKLTTALENQKKKDTLLNILQSKL